MVWVAITVLALVALAPLAVALKRGASARGAGALAVALHRTQLSELDRDLAEGRILPTEHATAVLEVQRRLLAAAEKPEAAATVGARWPVLACIVAVPALAVGLYLVGGKPEMPSVQPGGGPVLQQRLSEEASMVDQLRERLKTLDPSTEQARTGYVLLGNVEESRGNDAAAAAAWRVALHSKFDATLAVRTAVASSRVENVVSVESAMLLRQALAAAPPDAPWRAGVESMLKDAGR